MTTFTVVSAAQKKTLTGKNGGQMQVVKLCLQEPGRGEGDTTDAEWFTPAATPLPKAGDKLEGTLEDSDYGPKFKKAGGGGGGGGGGNRDLSPEAIERIEATGRVKGRCHAQAMALEYAQVKAMQGKLPDDFKPADLKPIVDWFVEDAESAR